MSLSKVKTPKVIKFIYRNKERSWLKVDKFENNYSEDNKKSWSIDFKRTKELGHVVYYGSKYGYKWKWDKKTCIVKGKRYYTFKACRTSSRLIADAIKNKQLDYYH